MSEVERLKEALRSNAQLLLKREQQLIAQGAAGQRATAWLKAFRRLTKEPPSDRLWAECMVRDLHFQVAAIYAGHDPLELELVTGLSHSHLPQRFSIDVMAGQMLAERTEGVETDVALSPLAEVGRLLQLKQMFWSCASMGERFYWLLGGFSTRGAGRIHPQDQGYFEMLAQHALIGRRNDELSDELRESEASFKRIFDTMQDGFIQVNDGRVSLANPATLEMLGFSREELIGTELQSLFADPAEFLVVMAELQALGQLPHHQVRLRRKDGVVRVFEGSPRVLRGVLEVIFRDVTEKLRLEEERQARQAADAANALKSQFLATMSHEIRTPLNAILGLTYLALEQCEQDLLRDYLAKVHRAGKSLKGIVDDILDFSKIEAGRLTLEKTELALDEVVEQVVSTAEATAHEKGLALRVDVAPDVPRYLRGDPLRLGQVLTNLVGNAVKFTERGEVSLAITSRQGRLRFEVRDSGRGMSPEELKGVFQPFFQADSSITRRYGGTGLGLAISHQLVTLMGGKIAVESEPGVGSTLSFELAFEVSEEPVAVPQSYDWSHLRGRRVLVVEDNKINQQVARELLVHEGMEVELADNGRDALERDGPWDVILMDLQMPVMDGYTATRAMRALRSTPIIAMTAHVLQAERDRCRQAGMDDYVTKPLEPLELLKTVSRWVATAAESPPVVEGRLREQLDELAALLRSSDGAAVAFVASLLREEMAPGARPALERIARAVRDFDFDGALLELAGI